MQVKKGALMAVERKGTGAVMSLTKPGPVAEERGRKRTRRSRS